MLLSPLTDVFTKIVYFFKPHSCLSEQLESKPEDFTPKPIPCLLNIITSRNDHIWRVGRCKTVDTCKYIEC